MAGEVENLSGKLGIDTTDFKTAIAAANREIRILESAFKAGAAALGDWSQSATGLEARAKTLTSQIDVQKLKVEALRAEHARLAAENGNNSRAAQDAEIKLNKETETLNKMQLELTDTNEALQEMERGNEGASDAVEDLGSSTDETSGKMEGFKRALGGLGAVIKTTLGVVIGLATAVAAIGAAVGGMIFQTAASSAGLVDLSTKTGISVERLQEMDYIANQVGTSLETITSAQAKLVRSMASGADGTGDQAKAFATLGVSVSDANGKLRNTETVFAETIEALGKIQNPAERDALAMSIFGKSAQELNPLIKAGTEELNRLAEQAREVGAVMSEEDVAAFEAFDDTLASLQAGLKGTVGTLLTAFLPGFQAVFDQVGGYLKSFADIVNGSGGDFGKVAEGLTGLITQIASDLAQQAPQFLEAGLGIVQSILKAITSALPSLLGAAISILSSLINFIVDNLPVVLDAGVQILLTLVDALIQNLPMLINAALQAVITLANGLSQALPTLIPAVVQAVITIVQTLTDNIPLLVEAALGLILGLSEGLIVALPQLIAAIPVLMEGVYNALLRAAPIFTSMGGQLLGQLVYGLLAAIPVLITAIGQLIVVAGKALVNWVLQAPTIGKNFIEGLIQGLKSAQGLLYDAVTKLVDGMITSMKSVLGISSPSRVGRGIGRNVFESLALGGQDALQGVMRSFASMTSRVAAAAATAIGGTSITSNQTHNNVPIYGNVIVQGSTTPDSLIEEALALRY